MNDEAWFLLSLLQIVLFCMAGFFALYYRGEWIKERDKNKAADKERK